MKVKIFIDIFEDFVKLFCCKNTVAPVKLCSMFILTTILATNLILNTKYMLINKKSLAVEARLCVPGAEGGNRTPRA